MRLCDFQAHCANLDNDKINYNLEVLLSTHTYYTLNYTNYKRSEKKSFGMKVCGRQGKKHWNEHIFFKRCARPANSDIMH